MDQPRIDEQDAKQGRKGLHVLTVLIAGLAIAGVAALIFAIT